MRPRHAISINIFKSELPDILTVDLEKIPTVQNFCRRYTFVVYVFQNM